MTSWLQRMKGHPGIPQQTSFDPGPHRKHSTAAPDTNAPARRFQIRQKCLYERTFPGEAFVSAHVNRLQRGYYESKNVHEQTIDSVYFVAIHFVFHPANHRTHRFKSANIRVMVHGVDPWDSVRKGYYGPSPSSPRILKVAPDIIYGAVSPENLQWNFSLSSSLGISHTPVAASINPSGGVKSNYKVYDMMTVQGSLRTLKNSLGPEYDVADGMAVWTLDENLLQRSGLPREFDFVLLVHQPEDVKNMILTVDMDADVQSWSGAYPQWYTNLSKYQPSQDYNLDFKEEVGQKFHPAHPTRGFNFADLPHRLDEYVQMPGTKYPVDDDAKGGSKRDGPRTPKRPYSEIPWEQFQSPPATPDANGHPATPPRGPRTPARAQTTSSRNSIPQTLNVHVTLEHSNPRSPLMRRLSESPASSYDPTRQQSIRRRRSRSELKEYSAQQALRSARLNEKIG